MSSAYFHTPSDNFCVENSTQQLSNPQNSYVSLPEELTGQHCVMLFVTMPFEKARMASFLKSNGFFFGEINKSCGRGLARRT